MKRVYPIVMTPSKIGYVVFVPTLDINTQGRDLNEAIEMARDAIGLWGICEEDAGRIIPEAPNLSPQGNDNDIVTLVDVDFTAYRKAHDNRMVRRNVTVPSWLNEKAEEAGINVSGILQKALKEELHVG